MRNPARAGGRSDLFAPVFLFTDPFAGILGVRW